MKQTHEFFSNFPTQEEYFYNRDKGYSEIAGDLGEWGKGRVIFTMSLTEYKKLKKTIAQTNDKYSKLKPLLKNNKSDSKETKDKEQKNSNNQYREFRFNEDIREDLISKLLLDGKLSEFIENNGEVRNNTEKFECFCDELLKETFIDKFDYEEFILECNSNKNDEIEKKIEEKNEIDDKLEEDIKEIEDEKGRPEDIVLNNNEDIILVDEIKQYYLENIRKDENVLKIFVLSYHIMKYKIGINKDMSPADMSNDFQDESIQEELKGQVKPEEKEEILERFLDPHRFWNSFEIEFSNEINIFDYYTVLYDLVTRPKIIKKEKAGKIYLSEELTKTHYRKMNNLQEIMDKFIDDCNENIKKDKDIIDLAEKCIKLLTTKENISNINSGFLIEKFLEEIKIKQKLCFIKTTRTNDLKIKYEILENFENMEICKKYSDEDLSLYAIGKINDENKKEEIEKHLMSCKKCRDFYNVVSKGNEYRKKRNEQIAFMLKKPYDKPVKSLTEEEYLENSSIKYFKDIFRNNPCDTNFYYLILSLIDNGMIDEAKKIFNDGMSVYESGSFMSKTQIDLNKIK